MNPFSYGSFPNANVAQRRSPMTNVPPDRTKLPLPVQQDLSQLLLKHDPQARRLIDFIPHVKVSRYNTIELRWETISYIEGMLFAYAREGMNGDGSALMDALIVINQDQHFIQIIDRTISCQVDQLRLFYQVTSNAHPQVFCLHFNHGHEATRIETFLRRSFQSVATSNGETESKAHSTPVFQQETPSMRLNPPMPMASSPSPILSAQPTDLTVELKRMLNIDDNDSNRLLPPAAFESVSSTSRIPPGFPTIDREQVRQTLLHLIERDDQFLDTIYRTYLQRSSMPR